jgi:hypothetical protein
MAYQYTQFVVGIFQGVTTEFIKSNKTSIRLYKTKSQLTPLE